MHVCSNFHFVQLRNDLFKDQINYDYILDQEEEDKDKAQTVRKGHFEEEVKKINRGVL